MMLDSKSHVSFHKAGVKYGFELAGDEELLLETMKPAARAKGGHASTRRSAAPLFMHLGIEG
jgi:hypothetical protein